jgi:internalin A
VADTDSPARAAGQRYPQSFRGLPSAIFPGRQNRPRLKGLVNLTSLDLQSNGIGDISPLVSLCNLQKINLSGCHIDRNAPAFWMLPSLQEAILLKASLRGVPVEILSKYPSDKCLDRLRAHLADLTGDDVAVGDVKSSS